MTLFLFIFFLLLIIYGLLIDYYRRAWNALEEPVSAEAAAVKVSVVVAVRNEQHTIGKLLDCLLRQSYPKHLYEIIIVDDHSSDNTEEQVGAMPLPGLNLRYIRLAAGAESKKTAIAAGISEAIGELILTTDADCTMGPAWIGTIADFYSRTRSEFIAAPVLMGGSRSFAGIFQSLDFLTLQGITGASVSKRLHMMCNGANLAYTRSAFFEVDGFAGIDHIPSGDDMLLMQKIFTKYPGQVRYLKSREAIVFTMPERSWKDFFHQRIRWASKAVHYQDRKIFRVLLLTYLVNLCFLALGIASVVHYSWLTFLFLFLVAKTIIEFPFVNSVAIFFNQSSLMVYFPMLEPVHILYTIIAGWLGRFGSYTWKARVIKNF